MSIYKKTVGMLTLAALLSGCSSAPAVEKEAKTPLKVGVLAPFSGDAASYGEEIQIVLTQTAAQLNTTETQVELVYEDSKCTGQDAVTAYQKLIDIDGVDVILGGTCSSESLAIAPLLETNNMVALSAASSNPNIEGASPNLFTLAYNDYITADGMTEQAEKFTKVAIITEQNDYNIGIQKILETNLGKSVVSNEVFEKGATDMRNIIQKALSQKPEALILNPNVGTTAQVLLRQLAEFESELEGVQLISQIAYMSAEARQDASSLSEGMMIIDAPSIQSEEMNQLKKSLSAPTNYLGDFMTATSHDALINLVRAYNDSYSNGTTLRQELTENPLQGIVAGGKSFEDKNFLQGIKTGLYIVQEEEAVYQD